MHPTYKKMIYKMLENDKNTKPEDPWMLYILRCRDGSFYTGVTKDMERRMKMHQKGKASRYTRTRLPVELLYEEICLGRPQALVRECEVKAYPKKRKEQLIGGKRVELLQGAARKSKIMQRERKKVGRKKNKPV